MIIMSRLVCIKVPGRQNPALNVVIAAVMNLSGRVLFALWGFILPRSLTAALSGVEGISAAFLRFWHGWFSNCVKVPLILKT